MKCFWLWASNSDRISLNLIFFPSLKVPSINSCRITAFWKAFWVVSLNKKVEVQVEAEFWQTQEQMTNEVLGKKITNCSENHPPKDFSSICTSSLATEAVDRNLGSRWKIWSRSTKKLPLESAWCLAEGQSKPSGFVCGSRNMNWTLWTAESHPSVVYVSSWFRNYNTRLRLWNFNILLLHVHFEIWNFFLPSNIFNIVESFMKTDYHT